MSKNLLTVILPVHNAMPFLPAAVQSLFTQSQKDLELLFLDDGSTDGSGEYLEALKFPGLTVIRRSQQGVGAVRNYGLERCETEYLALMDADDLSMPDRLSAQLGYLQANPECVMLGTQIDFLIGGTVQRGLPCATRHEEIQNRLMFGSGIVYPTVMLRTRIARLIGGFRLKGAGEEYDFCLRMSENGRVANLPRVLYQFRLHRHSISMTKQADLLRGSAYAKTTALQRRSGLPEISFEDFQKAWKRRGPAALLSERIRLTSNMSYRLGRINVAEGRRALGLLQMATAATLDPVVASAHLRRIASSRIASSRIFGRRLVRELSLNRVE
jgi:glycosyltransferase involved in cell wall biosynthesis